MFAVHVRRPPADLTRRQAGLLLDGGVRRWSQLGLPGGRLTVTRKPAALRSLAPDTVAVVPASKVGPGVRVLSVEGVHPLRDPDDYPIRAAGPDPGRVTTLTVVGDIMLGRRVGERAAAEGDPSYPLRPMQRRLRSADITVGNLESTLSTDGSPTQGGDSFAADPRVRDGPAGGGLRRALAGEQPRRRLRRDGAGADRRPARRRRPAPVRRGPRPGRRPPAGGRRAARRPLRLRGVQRHRRDPRGRSRPAGCELGQHADPHRAARPGRARPRARATYDDSPAAWTW